MQIPILEGIFADLNADFRSGYPRNMVPVPKDSGVSKGYLRMAEGLAAFPVNIVSTVDITSISGPDRGGVNWNGTQYRVIGDAFVQINADGSLLILARVPGTEAVTFDYAFDRLGLCAGGNLYYWDGSTFVRVTDPDLGIALDMVWLGGYFLTTDGESIVSTDLNNPLSVNPLKYGSSEVDPDPIKGLFKLRNELYAFNRYTTQVFRNVGGTGFPFALIDGALITRGAIGSHSMDAFGGAIAFLGSGRNEQPSVYVAGNGETAKIATREIEMLLRTFTEAQLSQVVCETREHDEHVHFYIHLPTLTAVYDGNASKLSGRPVWFYLSSGANGYGAYEWRNFVYCYDQWFAGRFTSTFQIGTIVENSAYHLGTPVGWEFSTQALYNDGSGFIIQNLELVALTGRPGPIPAAQNFVDWKIGVEFTVDGITWSQKRFVSAGKAGEYAKRIAWRQPYAAEQRNWLAIRFSGNQPMPVSFARIESVVEPLHG